MLTYFRCVDGKIERRPWGMNFDHMPELRLASWPVLPIALMVAASGGLPYCFKRRGWI